MHPVLTHLALHVRDLDTSMAFYRDYCGMQVVHERAADGRRVVWLAEPGREQEFIFVLVPGGPGQSRAAGYLVLEPREEPYPVGYYCGIRAPDGNMVEFSYGQPLGPGAKEQSEEETDAAHA